MEIPKRLYKGRDFLAFAEALEGGTVILICPRHPSWKLLLKLHEEQRIQMLKMDRVSLRRRCENRFHLNRVVDRTKGFIALSLLRSHAHKTRWRRVTRRPLLVQSHDACGPCPEGERSLGLLWLKDKGQRIMSWEVVSTPAIVPLVDGCYVTRIVSSNSATERHRE